jgi:hypothetical protein
VLAFERLETKSTPSTLLLALAPQNDSFHVSLEGIGDNSSSDGPDWVAVDTSANWRFEFSTQQLLYFVEENTWQPRRDTNPVSVPTAAQCQRIDEMMKLDDSEIRALVIVDP